MEQERYYFRVGLFVTIIITLAVVVLSWFSGRKDTKNYRTYAIFFESSVEGLSLGSPVKFRGIQVGQVIDINFVTYESDHIQVLVNIDDAAPIRTDTVAAIQLQGITGVSMIALENTGIKADALTKKKGEPYRVIASKRSSLEKVVNTVPELIEQFTKLSTQGQKFLSDENIESFSLMLKDLHALVAEGKVATKELAQLEAQGNKLLSDANIKAITQMLAELQLATQQMNETLAEGKTTLREARMLTKTLRENPSQILRGSEYKGYKVAP